MIIECEEDPWVLIGEIGSPNFSIDEDQQEHMHPHHPNTIRIFDSRYDTSIDVTGEGIEETWEIARNLVKLLNQDYWRPGIRQK